MLNKLYIIYIQNVIRLTDIYDYKIITKGASNYLSTNLNNSYKLRNITFV